jgi:ethanolamine utilization protein EutN
MVLAKVVGNLVSTIKHRAYATKKIMMVQPVDMESKPYGSVMIAVDAVGAGDGELVVVTQEGKAAGEILGLPPQSPVRSVIVGIVDHLEYKT